MADENGINWDELVKDDEFWKRAFEHDRFKALTQQKNEADKAKVALQKQLDGLQKQLDEAVNGKKTDLEKVQGQLAQLQTQFEESQTALQRATHERLRLEVAAELGLPSQLANRLTGDTREALLEDAKVLQPLLKPATPGTPPAPTRTELAQFTAEQLNDPEWVRKNQAKILAASA